MPLILHPNQTVEIVLDEHKNQPQPPVFLVRALNMQQQLELRQRIESHETDGLFAAENPDLVALLADYVIGWKNMGEWQFDRERLPEQLQAMMARRDGLELMWKILSMNTLTPEQKKS